MSKCEQYQAAMVQLNAVEAALASLDDAAFLLKRGGLLDEATKIEAVLPPLAALADNLAKLIAGLKPLRKPEI